VPIESRDAVGSLWTLLPSIKNCTFRQFQRRLLCSRKRVLGVKSRSRQGFTARHRSLGTVQTDRLDARASKHSRGFIIIKVLSRSIVPFTTSSTPVASPYCKDEVADTICIAAIGTMYMRMLSNTHVQLGRSRLDLPLLVQLPSSRKHTLPLPYRKASGHPRLSDYPHASR
jgi:hypothetical protein